jgi:hypothetical protein
LNKTLAEGQPLSLAPKNLSRKPIVQSLAWRWRELWRRSLPRGLVIFPFERNAALKGLWPTSAQASAAVVYWAYALIGVLMLADLSTHGPIEFPWSSVFRYRWLALIRFPALAALIILLAVSVVAQCRWWRARGRIEELFVTSFANGDLLSALWVPPYVHIVSAYGIGFIWHVLWAGEWLALARIGYAQWLQLISAPLNLSFALVEVSLAVLGFRAIAVCSLMGALRTSKAHGVALRAIGASLKYMLLAAAGGLFTHGLVILAAVVCMIFSLMIPRMIWGFFALGAISLLSLSRQVSTELIDDYEEVQRKWVKWWKEENEK